MKKLSKLFVTASLALAITTSFAPNASADANSYIGKAKTYIGKSLDKNSAIQLVNSAALQGLRVVLVTNYEFQKISKTNGTIYIILDGGQNNYRVREVKVG